MSPPRKKEKKEGVIRLPPDEEIDFDFQSHLTDQAFIVEGRRIYAGKDFLSLHSPFFNTLLNGEFSEKNQKEIELKDVSHYDFEFMLAVLYGKEWEEPPLRIVHDEMADALLKLGNQFTIKAIVDHVEDELIRYDESTYSLANKMLLADRYRLIRLHTYCLGKMIDDDSDPKEALRDLKKSKKFGKLSLATQSACEKYLNGVEHADMDMKCVPLRLEDGYTTMIEGVNLMEGIDKKDLLASGYIPSIFTFYNNYGINEEFVFVKDDMLGDTSSTEIGGLLWTVDGKCEKIEDEQYRLSFCLVANYDRPSGMNWSAEGIVEIELINPVGKEGRHLDPIKKQYALSLNNDIRKGWTGEVFVVNDVYDYCRSINTTSPDFFPHDIEGLRVVTKIHLRKLTGMREIPQFDFTLPSSLSDATLVVGGKKLYVNKQYLSIVSDEFRALFDEDPSGIKNEFELKGVEYQAFIELLYWTYPSAKKNFTEDTTMVRLVGLGERFYIVCIHVRITRYLVFTCPFAHFALRMVLHFEYDIDDDKNFSFWMLEIADECNIGLSSFLSFIQNTRIYKEMNCEKKIKMLEWMINEEK